MNRNQLFVTGLATFLVGIGTLANSKNYAFAQIVPDATLPSKSSVIQGNTSIITGGTVAGSNLFHSFEKFSVPTGSAAYFNNALDIQNIISRVTGGSVSKIDGLIQANGTANLFLLNPNGIIFGPNAQLNIGGSFVGSTASSINFGDGTQFSATTHTNTHLLTISVPIGLQLGSNPGAISVQGKGHNLIGASFSPAIRGSSLITNLQVQPKKTLALVGGSITLEGGILRAPAGRIELGSAGSGLVSLSSTTSGWALGYQGVQTFQDIYLDQKALADVSGFGSGSIQIQGRTLTLTDGSVILIQNQGGFLGGTLSVNTSDFLQVVGGTDAKIATSLRNETVGLGKGGDITVSTKRLVLQNGGQINSFTFSNATSGKIIINATDSVQLFGVSSLNPSVFSEVANATFNSGNAGDITVSTKRVTATGGGSLTSATFGSGKGGNLTVNATNYVELIGVEPTFLRPSAFNATALNAGDAGSLTINTSKLIVRDGGRVDSSTLASGNAGSVTIKASDSIEVSGTVPSSRNPSLVISSANIVDESLQRLLRLPSVPSGASGNVKIDTGRLSVTEGGQVTVTNDGIGNAGILEINANFIDLDNQAGITASTQSGRESNISINSRNLLLLRDNSKVSAEARGTGNGGNITIRTPLIIAVPKENSDIIANAFKGRGGNINITASGVLGIQPWNQDTPQSDITASSQLGINGTVQINTPDVNPNPETAKPVVQPETPQVADVCQRGSRASEFVITGTGGIPPSPSDPLTSMTGWEDLPPSGVPDNFVSPATEQVNSVPTEIVEAQGWIRNPDGTITLTAEATPFVPYSSLATPMCLTQPSSARVVPSSSHKNAAE